jgi:hypothetical protein
MATCEACGGYSGLPVEHHSIYEVPDVWETLCRDCAEELNTHTAADMSDGELVAAIMDDSLGYASPKHAQQHVEAFREGKNFAFCERAISCFPADPDDYTAEKMHPDETVELDTVACDGGDTMRTLQSNTGITPGDLNRLIDSARRRWCTMSDDKQEELREFAEEWDSLDDPAASMGVSMSYPVGGP